MLSGAFGHGKAGYLHIHPKRAWARPDLISEILREFSDRDIGLSSGLVGVF